MHGCPAICAGSVVMRSPASLTPTYGAVIRSLPHDEAVVLTSDPDDIVRVAGDRPVRPVRV
jgi:hypothetical protein